MSVNKIKSAILNKLKIIFTKVYLYKLKNKVFMIHTLGKVGSSTIYYELKQLSPWNNVYHTHFLSEEWLNKRLKGGNHYSANLKASEKVNNYLKNNPDKKKHIITLVREPVSRELSNFMQNPQDIIDGDILSYKIEDLKRIYLKKISYEYTLNWFDTEFYNYLKFDVFTHSFNKEKGFSIYNYKDYKILVIKLEKLNDCYTEAMQEYIGLNLKLKTTSNLSKDKPISKIYNSLKKDLSFSKDELEQVYSSKYVQHFYTPKEIENFVKKYSK